MPRNRTNKVDEPAEVDVTVAETKVDVATSKEEIGAI
jgi:hypothetical protein